VSIKETKENADLRVKYKIPEHYRFSLKWPDGKISFSYMDSDIVIYPNGEATETHMGLGSEGHEFFTTEWKP
jgi:hypothetical protein